MPQQELGFLQANFRLTVRKAGLQTLSFKELEKLAESIIIMTQSHTMRNDYVVSLGMTLDGVMTSTNT